MSAKSQTPPRPGVLWLARTLLVVVSWGGAEGMLALGGYPEWWELDPEWGKLAPDLACDAELGWSPREGSFELTWPGTDAQFHYTQLSGGRRATSEGEQPEPAELGSEGPLPVLFFGDSYVQGYGLSDSDTLSWKVQERHPELAVYNYGVGNQGTYQAYLTMRRVVQGPASTYLMLNGFHEARNAGAPSWLRLNQAMPEGCTFPYAVFDGDTLEPHHSPGNVNWTLSRHSHVIAMLQEYTQIFDSMFRVRDQRATTKQLLSRMNRLSIDQQGEFTVILMDLDQEQYDEYKSFLEAEEIRYIDYNFKDMYDLEFRLPDRHPNGKLNQALAEFLEPVALPARSTLSQDLGVGGHEVVR